MSLRKLPSFVASAVLVALIIVATHKASMDVVTVETESNAIVETTYSYTNESPSLVKTTNNNNNNNNNNSQPHLVMIVGPPKCGTTTLQYVLNLLKEEIKNDGYVPQGRFEGEGLENAERFPPLLQNLHDHRCQNETEEARIQSMPIPQCWKTVTDELDRVYATGANMVLVEEDLCTAHFDIPSFLAATAKWQVEVVMLYRPLFKWLPSSLNQHEHGKSALNRFPTEPMSNEYSFWSHDRHRPLRAPPFFQAVANSSIRNDIGLHYFDQVLNKYQDLTVWSKTVTISFIKLQDDIVEQFFCHKLAAKESCHAFHNITIPHMNPSVVMDYHLIATAAIDQGIFNLTRNDKEIRQTVTDALLHFHQEELNSQPLPLECTDQHALDALLNESLRIEREMVPQFYNETLHRIEFAQAVEKKKFCSVNTTAVLQDSRWRSFLANATFLNSFNGTL